MPSESEGSAIKIRPAQTSDAKAKSKSGVRIYTESSRSAILTGGCGNRSIKWRWQLRLEKAGLSPAVVAGIICADRDGRIGFVQ